MLVAAEVGLPRFNCPHCGAFAQQNWYVAGARGVPPGQSADSYLLDRRAVFGATLDSTKDANYQRYLARGLSKVGKGGTYIYTPTQISRLDYQLEVCNLAFSRCESCSDVAVWLSDELIWPPASTAPIPNADLSADVVSDFEEAGRILAASPRGAAALLRLAIQKLCNEVTGKSQDIAVSIRELEARGLSQQIVDALHVVRVVGNESVHPGKLDVRDDPAIAHSLFSLVNRIADALVSQPKRDAELWAKLPEAKRKQIEAERAAKAGGGAASKS